MTNPQSKSPNRRSLRKRQSARERTPQRNGTQEREQTPSASQAPRTPENGTTPFTGHRTPEEHHRTARALPVPKNAGERTNDGSETTPERLPDSRSAPGGMAGGCPSRRIRYGPQSIARTRSRAGRACAARRSRASRVTYT